MNKERTVEEVVRQVAARAGTERETAVALHDYVRDQVKFGFNKYFDASTPDYTLSFGYGHCNPKSRLMVALFRAAGLESYQHFVAIPHDILKDAIAPTRFWMIPAELDHSYVEVKVDDKWRAIDSFIVDTGLLEGGKARLAQEGRSVGYGVRSDSTNTWDGERDAFSQFDPSMMIEDHGRIEDLEAYFHSKSYRHVMLGILFNTMFRMMGEFGVAPMNAHIEKIRQPVGSLKTARV